MARSCRAGCRCGENPDASNPGSPRRAYGASVPSFIANLTGRSKVCALLGLAGDFLENRPPDLLLRLSEGHCLIGRHIAGVSAICRKLRANLFVLDGGAQIGIDLAD